MEDQSEQKSIKNILAAAVTAVVFLAIGLGVVALTKDLSQGEFWFYVAFFAIVVTLVWLKSRYPVVGVAIERFFGVYFRFLAWMILTILPLWLFTFISNLLITRAGLIVQLLVFAVWGGLLVYGIRMIATERNRERLFGPGKTGNVWKIGKISPAVFAFDIAVIAMMFFSSITFVLIQAGAVELLPSSEAGVTYDSIMAFYFWHFLEAIPLLNVNETLQWKEPLTYQGAAVGSVLLLFKLAVIIPVIAAFTWYWKQLTDSKPAPVETRSDAMPWLY